MLIPRYSLRTTLIGVTICAVFFLIAGEALRGHEWAVVITITVVSILGMFAVHASLYLLASYFGKIIGAPLSPARTNQGGMQTSSDKRFPPTLDDTPENS
ncbi:MAG: hypothetical protein GXP26_15390 [Planctomycetes bacterium]|nr:hypothetical protein [Planctomycetota bacterium]